jgi:DNA uptake protein ComE-like DNA-binding protein
VRNRDTVDSRSPTDRIGGREFWASQRSSVSDGRGWRVVRHAIAAWGPPAGKARDRTKPKPAGRIDVNTASQVELEALRRIGPVIARRIIEGRPYRSVEELERVKGIGKKRLEEIRPLVNVE